MIFIRILVGISSEAILLKLLPKARQSSAFWLGFWLRILNEHESNESNE